MPNDLTQQATKQIILTSMTLICVVQHFWSVVLFWDCQTGPEKKKKMTVLLLLFLFLFRLWVFLYFIFIFISSSYTRFAQKFPENQKIKKFWPYTCFISNSLPIWKIHLRWKYISDKKPVSHPYKKGPPYQGKQVL